MRKFFSDPIGPIAVLMMVGAIILAFHFRPEPDPAIQGEVVSKRHIYEHGRPGHRVPECLRLDIQPDQGDKLKALCVSDATFQTVQIGDLYHQRPEDRVTE